MDLTKEVDELAGTAVKTVLVDPLEGGPFYVLRLTFSPWPLESEEIDDILLPVLEEQGYAGCSIELLDGPTLVLRTHTFLEEGVDPDLAHRQLVDALRAAMPTGYQLKTEWTKVEHWDLAFETAIF